MRQRGRLSAAASGAASATSAIAGQAVAASPERKERMKTAASAMFSSAAKGSAAAGTKQYPRLRGARGQRGLDPRHLESGKLPTHRPWPMNAPRGRTGQCPKRTGTGVMYATPWTRYERTTTGPLLIGGASKSRAGRKLCAQASTAPPVLSAVTGFSRPRVLRGPRPSGGRRGHGLMKQLRVEYNYLLIFLYYLCVKFLTQNPHVITARWSSLK